MTSTNDELPPPPKPRASPFDFRNTDLVSRLLAATPPYLYNMPLIPHSFFFSEMLRSLVQAKNESASRNPSAPHMHHRRPRKRSWTQVNSDYYMHKDPTKTEKIDMPPPASWISKPDVSEPPYTNKIEDIPLELTTDKLTVSSSSVPKTLHEDGQPDNKFIYRSPVENSLSNSNQTDLKAKNAQYPFPHNPHLQNSSEVVLPPPPPMWYPALYPTPYGIDPLHFFIDLRVSGHIYDRKNQRESSTSPETTTSTISPNLNNCTQDTNISEALYTEPIPDPFRQSRHTSAFSVPSSRLAKNIPINLSNYQPLRKTIEHKPETKDISGHTKFDVKSMGFERSSNKLSSNYIMTNIFKIYKDLQERVQTDEGPQESEPLKQEENVGSPLGSPDAKINQEEPGNENKKKVKGLRALIGLELVVDYMNHAKPGDQTRNSDDSSTDLDSSESTTVDVVALQEEI
ncbi:hypothetical protein PPYR_04489 [Photinus pyralis]|uniref:Uncharacterized protein n=1 Tax=Photinus pyralis TaxID=7054 RepID=A0A5N4AYF0_PHOPY|nr:uncharacterized protein LOC116164237 [Photinus pyralis]XP_031334242.1 uncharacterized protein LOC116164237 [Photinus pyralis]KAB0802303.1 hypothetical protein PPYR_04489 [Photinus pyralis]